jgi:ATP-dependent Clp protease adaptor protein ClpS|tara:strand:- start:2023 stop:2346 length:324 start_codon:yes stop_codon:yes gene_type:complete
MTEKNNNQVQTNELVIEELSEKVKQPSLYRVLLINDDYTPMEFVVEVLVNVFAMDKSSATRVMLDVHTKGKGICGIYSYEIAETRVAQVTKMAKEYQHPLLCLMEED